MMKLKSNWRILITPTGNGLVVFLVMVIMLTSCQPTYPAETFTSTAQTDTTQELSVAGETDDGSAELLSAFFGLDNALPKSAANANYTKLQFNKLMVRAAKYLLLPLAIWQMAIIITNFVSTLSIFPFLFHFPQAI